MNLEYVGHSKGERLRYSDLEVGMQVRVIDFDDDSELGREEREDFSYSVMEFPFSLIVKEIPPPCGWRRLHSRW